METKMTLETITKPELPPFVSMNGIELRLRGKEYWRDAGLWSVNYKIIDGKLLSWCWRSPVHKYHRVELIPITEEKWRIGNIGHIKYYKTKG